MVQQLAKDCSRQVLSGDIGWLRDAHAWPGLQAIGKVEATREIDGRTSTQTRYSLLSQVFDPDRLNAIVRSHWEIENSLHWVLDVTMDEDRARNRKDHWPGKPRSAPQAGPGRRCAA